MLWLGWFVGSTAIQAKRRSRASVSFETFQRISESGEHTIAVALLSNEIFNALDVAFRVNEPQESTGLTCEHYKFN